MSSYQVEYWSKKYYFWSKDYNKLLKKIIEKRKF